MQGDEDEEDGTAPRSTADTGHGETPRGPGVSWHQAGVAWTRGWLADGTVGERRKLIMVRRKTGASASLGDTPGCHLRPGGREGEQVCQAGSAGHRSILEPGPRGLEHPKPKALVPVSSPVVTKPGSGCYMPVGCPVRLMTACRPSSGSSRPRQAESPTQLGTGAVGARWMTCAGTSLASGRLRASLGFPQSS